MKTLKKEEEKSLRSFYRKLNWIGACLDAAGTEVWISGMKQAGIDLVCWKKDVGKYGW